MVRNSSSRIQRGPLLGDPGYGHDALCFGSGIAAGCLGRLGQPRDTTREGIGGFELVAGAGFKGSDGVLRLLPHPGGPRTVKPMGKETSGPESCAGFFVVLLLVPVGLLIGFVLYLVLIARAPRLSQAGKSPFTGAGGFLCGPLEPGGIGRVHSFLRRFSRRLGSDPVVRLGRAWYRDRQRTGIEDSETTSVSGGTRWRFLCARPTGSPGTIRTPHPDTFVVAGAAVEGVGAVAAVEVVVANSPPRGLSVPSPPLR